MAHKRCSRCEYYVSAEFATEVGVTSSGRNPYTTYGVFHDQRGYTLCQECWDALEKFLMGESS